MKLILSSRIQPWIINPELKLCNNNHQEVVSMKRQLSLFEWDCPWQPLIWAPCLSLDSLVGVGEACCIYGTITMNIKIPAFDIRLSDSLLCLLNCFQGSLSTAQHVSCQTGKELVLIFVSSPDETKICWHHTKQKNTWHTCRTSEVWLSLHDVKCNIWFYLQFIAPVLISKECYKCKHWMQFLHESFPFENYQEMSPQVGDQ